MAQNVRRVTAHTSTTVTYTRERLSLLTRLRLWVSWRRRRQRMIGVDDYLTVQE